MKQRMKSFRAILLLPFLAFALAMPAVAADDDDETPLEKAMYKMNKGYKLLGKQARKGDFDFDALAKAFGDAKVASEESAKLVPAKIAKMKDGDAKTKEIADFKKHIGALTKQLEAVITICKAKDADKLKAAYAKLKDMKKHGHDEFIEDE